MSQPTYETRCNDVALAGGPTRTIERYLRGCIASAVLQVVRQDYPEPACCQR